MSGKIVEYWKVESLGKGSAPLFSAIQIPKFPKGMRYESSGHLTDELKANCIHKIFEKFISDHSTKKNKTFIFSSEGWASDFQSADIAICGCEQIDFQVYIYQSVRPQIDMLIPAFLQWTLWTETPTLRASFHNLINFADWSKQSTNALKLGADQVSTRYVNDIVVDFCKLYNIDLEAVGDQLTKKVNRSLPIEAITLLLRNRELRPGPHDPHMDFLLEDYIDDAHIPVHDISLKVENDLLSEIYSHFQLSNVHLFESMSPEHSQAFAEKNLDSLNKLSKDTETFDLTSSTLNIDFLERLTVSLLLDLRKFQEINVSSKAERDGAIAERDGAIAERDGAIAERDGAIAERDGAIAERDGAIAERDGAIAERDGIRNSRIWRFTRIYRIIRSNLAR
jgi:hypothetical protein